MEVTMTETCGVKYTSGKGYYVLTKGDEMYASTLLINGNLFEMNEPKTHCTLPYNEIEERDDVIEVTLYAHD